MKFAQQDITSLAHKLERFSKDLPEQEKNVLAWLVARAKASTGEISDSDLDRVAGGLEEDLESIKVGWTR